MGCGSSKNSKVVVSTLETEDTRYEEEGVSDVTMEIANRWISVARMNLVYISTPRRTYREMQTPMFGVDTPGFGQ